MRYIRVRYIQILLYAFSLILDEGWTGIVDSVYIYIHLNFSVFLDEGWPSIVDFVHYIHTHPARLRGVAVARWVTFTIIKVLNLWKGNHSNDRTKQA